MESSAEWRAFEGQFLKVCADRCNKRGTNVLFVASATLLL